jgi:hypothetical protein
MQFRCHPIIVIKEVPMYLFIPGRHHIITQFQSVYLKSYAQGEDEIEGAIFAVTSANHQGTRRNPLSYSHRSLLIHQLGRDLNFPVYAFPVEDVGQRDDFAEYTVKTVNHRGEGLFRLTPENTTVCCSTAVADLYKELGYSIDPVEARPDAPKIAVQPWDLIEFIADTPDWQASPWLQERIHPGALQFIRQYGLDKLIQRVHGDPLLGEDGDLTETRDYGSYVRQMDENVKMKWEETRPYVQPGRIGDIGCAVGSWLKLASEESLLQDSDFYGIEITRALQDICQQRKQNGGFASPNIWFKARNAVSGRVFQQGSMNTIHTGSLTHEIASYGSIEALREFLHRRYEELAPGGIWINRDVVGPQNKDQKVLLWCEAESGEDQGDPSFLHSRALFPRFAQDFRAQEGYQMEYRTLEHKGDTYFSLRLEDACEFLLTKDYTDNWRSEMHERFCFWSLEDWKKEIEAAGFSLHPSSRALTNPWIRKNRWEGRSTSTTDRATPWIGPQLT